MSERFKFFTIDPDGILDNKTGHNIREALCRLVLAGKCPDPVFRQCARCDWAEKDHLLLDTETRDLETPTPSLEFTQGFPEDKDNKRDGALKEVSTLVTFKDGTEFELTHNEGQVMISRKNPPVLVK